ncbi:hypothetical protein V1503_23550 [Bacillus sp. SCS-151]|uniref:hypothetical protein n=1 Tax=Nanhaiella sioensis TaxID=3115293 RepID=UPI00397DF792
MLQLGELGELGVLVAVIYALGEVVNKLIPNKFIPIIRLSLGVIAGLVYIDAEGTKNALFYGIIIGLASNGLIDLNKFLVNKDGVVVYENDKGEPDVKLHDKEADLEQVDKDNEIETNNVTPSDHIVEKDKDKTDVKSQSKEEDLKQVYNDKIDINKFN